ncbi:AMP-dependent synthetase/ligase [Bifidobacterium pseudolongum]|uniref:AMP-dependent synthetase/ligase n=1 Tax=Bifidobacterium pseudolongum TaxID=1694 RepID=UPI00101F684B|nr:AMP-dependent synthetase/ligase [Bifidobacterium pseudolongum]RYQ31400.1 AMP-binding protein [Bifidobacterium pseudolongum subsp. globosum]
MSEDRSTQGTPTRTEDGTRNAGIVKQYETPLHTPIDPDINLFDFLQGRAKRNPDGSMVGYKDADGVWQSFTAVEFRDKVIAIAKGLIGWGARPGESIAIIAHTRWEWVALDMAIMAIGCVTIPVYETNSAAQMRTVFNDAEVVLVFAEDDTQRDKVESVSNESPSVRASFVIDSDAVDAIIAFGAHVSDEEFTKRKHAAHGDTLATIIYTSGSTGTPKGVEISHRNMAAECMHALQYMPRAIDIPDRRLLLFLPLSHVFARFMATVAFAGTLTLGLSSNMKTIIKDFEEFGPTLLLAVPRVFEKVYNAASQRAGSGFAGKMFLRGVAAAQEWSKYEQSGEKMPMSVKMRHAFYDKVVYSKIRTVFGPNADFAITGGAPMDPDLAHFYNGIGMPLLEGYGMTETSGPVCVSLPENNHIGTIGQPLCGTTVGIAEDGELCFKGNSVCMGYHNQPEVTSQQIVDGWLHTGDLGDVDDEGFITLTGRKKDLIITAGGKNVSPGQLETTVMTSPVVAQCLVIGDRKPFIAALVTLDLDDANAWLASQGAATADSLEELSKNPIVHAEVERIVNKANEGVSRAESIRKFEILPDEFTQANGMLTASLKSRRAQIVDHYRKLIDTVIYVPRKK